MAKITVELEVADKHKDYVARSIDTFFKHTIYEWAIDQEDIEEDLDVKLIALWI